MSRPSAAVSQKEGLVRPYKNLREWLAIVGEMGALKRGLMEAELSLPLP
ncbi:MAG: hypothetical protein HY694_18070 [Deltaproteobacteria bacterium]|nr:hypothetical protein [Deltaproteobacteria bacterium]